MELKDVNWKKVKWIIIIPILIIATIIYIVSGCQHQDITIAQGENDALASIDFADEITEKNNNEQEEVSEQSKNQKKNIYVDVGGAVINPKVVELKEGSRIYEAIEAAGGKSKTGVTRYLNMAAVCQDGQKIYIPVESEISKEDIKKVIETSAGYIGDASYSSGVGIDGKVNINTANADELQTLAGIGPSMASRIIQYRNDNGNYSSVEDLLNVSGIGEKTLAKFIENICI